MIDNRELGQVAFDAMAGGGAKGKKRVTIYWLMPAQSERAFFRKFIGILATEFDAPPFEPHVTLCRAASFEPVVKRLRKIRFASITLRVSDVAQSPKFTQSLIVRFRPSKRLDGVVSLLGSRSMPIKNPHLSLLYKRLPATTRRGLCRLIKLPFREVTFDSIAAMSCPSPTETAADVRSWQKISTTGARV